MILFQTLIWPLPTGLLYADSRVSLENNKKTRNLPPFCAY